MISSGCVISSGCATPVISSGCGISYGCATPVIGAGMATPVYSGTPISTPIATTPVAPATPAPIAAPTPEKKDEPKKEDKKEDPKNEVKSTNPNVATLVVNLPANSRLTVDGEATSQTSASRTFLSPILEKGKVYKYTLKAEIKVGDRTEVVTKEVQIRAGEKTVANLNAPATTVAAR